MKGGNKSRNAKIRRQNIRKLKNLVESERKEKIASAKTAWKAWGSRQLLAVLFLIFSSFWGQAEAAFPYVQIKSGGWSQIVYYFLNLMTVVFLLWDVLDVEVRRIGSLMVIWRHGRVARGDDAAVQQRKGLIYRMAWANIITSGVRYYLTKFPITVCLLNFVATMVRVDFTIVSSFILFFGAVAGLQLMVASSAVAVSLFPNRRKDAKSEDRPPIFPRIMVILCWLLAIWGYIVMLILHASWGHFFVFNWDQIVPTASLIFIVVSCIVVGRGPSGIVSPIVLVTSNVNSRDMMLGFLSITPADADNILGRAKVESMWKTKSASDRRRNFGLGLVCEPILCVIGASILLRLQKKNTDALRDINKIMNSILDDTQQHCCGAIVEFSVSKADSSGRPNPGLALLPWVAWFHQLIFQAVANIFFRGKRVQDIEDSITRTPIVRLSQRYADRLNGYRPALLTQDIQVDPFCSDELLQVGLDAMDSSATTFSNIIAPWIPRGLKLQRSHFRRIMCVPAAFAMRFDGLQNMLANTLLLWCDGTFLKRAFPPTVMAEFNLYNSGSESGRGGLVTRRKDILTQLPTWAIVQDMAKLKISAQGDLGTAPLETRFSTSDRNAQSSMATFGIGMYSVISDALFLRLLTAQGAAVNNVAVAWAAVADSDRGHFFGPAEPDMGAQAFFDRLPNDSPIGNAYNLENIFLSSGCVLRN